MADDETVYPDEAPTRVSDAAEASTRISNARDEPGAERQIRTGTVLFGEYEVVGVLGAGGMGEVYRARHRRLDETRAIKVMHPNMAADPAATELFDREAKALLSVRHEAVVHCHDLLSDDAGRVFLVMELIDGVSLADRLLDRGPLAPDEVRTLARRVGDGLAAAHGRGVIHRDLSPDNIILPGDRPEEAKLIDFGIAKVLAAGQETIVEGFKGKLSYASPEQLGFFGGQIDGRSDVYSLALVLYTAATGAPIPMGSSVVEAVDARRALTGVPSDCPAELREDIEALLALHPRDRPRSLAGRFGEAGEREDVGLPVAPRRRLAPWRIGAGLATAALAAAAVFAWRAPSDLDDAAPVAVVAPAAATPDESATRVGEPSVEEPVAEAPPKPRGPSGRDRLRIVGLLGGAKAALARGSLMNPPGDSAYDKYQQVLSLDPSNADARLGIEQVADRYLSLARGALERGDPEQAGSYLGNARKAVPEHPELAALESALKSALE